VKTVTDPPPTGTRTIFAVERPENGTTIRTLSAASAGVVTTRPRFCDVSQLASPNNSQTRR